MAAKNDITGDSLTSKNATEAYKDGWDRIFGAKDGNKDTMQSDEQGISGRVGQDIREEGKWQRD